jgi:pyridoxine 5-phosphate synthase
MPLLGVNIDHVATVRQARNTYEPDPVWAATLAELGGADGITIHLREDRRHIQDRDVRLLRETVHVKLNLELACESEVLDVACEIRPDQATLVPESREEVTTEGGLDVATHHRQVTESVRRLQDAGITVSLFIDPDAQQVEAAAATRAEAIELHTGCYALAVGDKRHDELIRLVEAGRLARERDLTLNAGHGLNYHNVQPVAVIQGMEELNIGHSIVARAVMVGMERAVREMKMLLTAAP